MQLFAVLLISMLLAIPRAEAALSTASRAFLDRASQLDVEGQGRSARVDLEKTPRAQVVTAVREGLGSEAPYPLLAAKAAAALRVTEAVPDLEAAFVKTGDWQIALAVGALASEAQKKTYGSQWASLLDKFESPTRVTIIETLSHWGLPLTKEQFERALRDDSDGVRQAAVHSFIRTREKLSLADQADRYRKAFAVKPYQARLSAMDSYLDLNPKDRAALASAVDAKLKSACKVEQKPDVKTACEAILKEAK